MSDERAIESLFPRVEKPGRYTGGEWNAARMDPGRVRARIALAFPELVRRILSEGHEVQFHAWDHRRWQDELPARSEAWIRQWFERGMAGFEALTGGRPTAFGAPAWLIDDRVLGLELGADDYVTKPFSVRELMARIKAVLRRAENENTEISTVITGAGNLRMDMERRVVTVADSPIELTRLEFDLLHRLLINPGRVLTRERLLEQAWGYDYVGDTRAVDSAVKRLRAKLRAASPKADCIESVRGLGYRIK